MDTKQVGHTPGPWNCNRASAGGHNIIVSEVAPVDVCVVSRANKDPSEIDANARLISAAPELLQACQTFAEWLRREEAGFDHEAHDRNTPEGEAAWRQWYDGNLAICDRAQDQARAAIAKATGSAQ